MPFHIPNEADVIGVGAGIQSEIEKGDIDILVAGFAGMGVVTGCAVTAQASPNMTVHVAAGQVSVGITTANVTGGNSPTITSDGSNPRFVFIEINPSGTIVVNQGTAAPIDGGLVYPAPTSGNVVLAVVYVPTSATTIISSYISDRRVVITNFVASTPDVVFSKAGTIATSTGHQRWYASGDEQIDSVIASLDTAPVGSDAVIDVKKNARDGGGTIFTTTLNRPTIADGTHYVRSVTPDVNTLVAGDYLTVDVITPGSTIAGSDLTVQVIFV